MIFQYAECDGSKIMSVFIKRTKTDRGCVQGFTLFLSCVPHITCSYCAMQCYLLADHRTKENPLFVFSNGLVLTKSLMQKQLQLYLSLCNYPAHKFSGHSFRAGCASTAAEAGMSDWEIKLLGRWSSDAYRGYIRISPDTISKLYSKLVI